ncbi:DUF3080 family protein [Catenovulum sp. SX2]|uniref:DUF3080 family protein n=1 Tax=Catenovulum sp. SX2 TaxID=3398614 RepID=UPI003F87A72A
MFGRQRLTVLAVMLLSVSACQQHPVVNEWEKYPLRVLTLAEKLLDQQINLPPKPQPIANLPIAGEKPPAFQLDFLEALSIHTCNLQAYIGEKNSSLGKVQSVANHFIYEANLLSQLNNCDYSQAAKATELMRLHKFKQQNWQQQVDYFLLNSEIHKKLFQPTTQMLIHDSQGVIEVAAYFQAANQLVQLPQQTFEQSIVDNFNKSSGQIHSSQLLAQYFYTLEYTTLVLQHTATVLNKLTSQQVCANTRPTEIDYLENVLHKYFVTELQPHLASLSRLQHELMPIVVELFNHLSFSPEYFERYLNLANGSIYSDFTQANISHQQAWQNLLASCSE